ncbi:MAG: cobalamin-dependent protein [Candidatus Lokiarchaeota archaeon]|nr:cobalamin-dependent protein [Candidatus Lokiarchaeota archaeon]
MDFEELTELIVELEVDDIADAVKVALDEDKKDPIEILTALTKGMDEVSRRYEKFEYFLGELVLAGDTMKAGLEVLKPALAVSDAAKEKIKAVIATVKGDQHDLGKNILGTMLLSANFEVYDLGRDVDADIIVEKVRETGASVVGLSSLLSMTVDQIGVVHEALKEAGLRDGVKLIVGGAPLNLELAKKFGADGYADDAIYGVDLIKKLTKT